jgi:CRP/FNR family transcriptional regulator, cyclic AMP receptor protein
MSAVVPSGKEPVIALRRGDEFFGVRSIFDQESLIDHLTNSAEKRLARTLLQLASEIGGDDTPLIPAGRVNQALLASMIGTTRSRVSVFLNRLKRQALITYDRHGHMSVRKPSLSAWLER